MHEALSSIQIALREGGEKRGGEEGRGKQETRRGGRGGEEEERGVRDHSHQVEVSVNPDGGPIPMPLEP